MGKASVSKSESKPFKKSDKGAAKESKHPNTTSFDDKPKKKDFKNKSFDKNNKKPMGKKPFVKSDGKKPFVKKDWSKSGKPTKPATEAGSSEVATGDSKSAHRREAKASLKASRNPQSETVKQLFKQYADLINTTKEGRDPASLIDKILSGLSLESLGEFIVTHSGSRVIQACLKHGSDEQRGRITESLHSSLFESVQANAFAMTAMEKLVNYGLLSDKKGTIEKLIQPLIENRKKVSKLFFHRIGSKYLNFVFSHKDISGSVKSALVKTLMTPPGGDLGLEISTEKMATFTQEFLKKSVDKELLDLSLTHRLWKSLMEHQLQSNTSEAVPPTFLTEALALLSGTPETIVRFLSSRDGVAVATYLLGVASAKDKKAIIKELKGKFVDIAKNSVDCAFLLRLIESTDDTVLIAKSVYSELIPELNELAFDQFGRLPFLFMLQNCSLSTKRYYPDHDRKLLTLAGVYTSLKSADAKAKELKGKVLSSLVNFAKTNFYDLSRDVYGKDVAIELLVNGGLDKASLVELIQRLLEKDNIGTHTVTVLLVGMKSTESIKSAILAILSKKQFAPKFVCSRWSFVLLEICKSDEKVVGKIQALGDRLDDFVFNSGEGNDERQKGIKALMQYVKEHPVVLSDTIAVSDHEDEEMAEDDEEGLVMMDD